MFQWKEHDQGLDAGMTGGCAGVENRGRSPAVWPGVVSPDEWVAVPEVGGAQVVDRAAPVQWRFRD